MTSKRKPYKTYPKEFKIEAVRMMKESDRPATVKKNIHSLKSQKSFFFMGVSADGPALMRFN